MDKLHLYKFSINITDEELAQCGDCIRHIDLADLYNSKFDKVQTNYYLSALVTKPWYGITSINGPKVIYVYENGQFKEFKRYRSDANYRSLSIKNFIKLNNLNVEWQQLSLAIDLKVKALEELIFHKITQTEIDNYEVEVLRVSDEGTKRDHLPNRSGKIKFIHNKFSMEVGFDTGENYNKLSIVIKD